MADAPQSTTAPVHGPTLKRETGPVAILFPSVGVVIGSGWLLGNYHATLIAGPAAVVSWVIGALAIMILGLNLAELGGSVATPPSSTFSPTVDSRRMGSTASWRR